MLLRPSRTKPASATSMGAILPPFHFLPQTLRSGVSAMTALIRPRCGINRRAMAAREIGRQQEDALRRHTAMSPRHGTFIDTAFSTLHDDTA